MLFAPIVNKYREHKVNMVTRGQPGVCYTMYLTALHFHYQLSEVLIVKKHYTYGNGAS